MSFVFIQLSYKQQTISFSILPSNAIIQVVGNLCLLSSYSYLTDSRQCPFQSYLHTAIIRVVGTLCLLSSYNYLTDSRQYFFNLTFIRLSYGQQVIYVFCLHTTILQIVDNVFFNLTFIRISYGQQVIHVICLHTAILQIVNNFKPFVSRLSCPYTDSRQTISISFTFYLD